MVKMEDKIPKEKETKKHQNQLFKPNILLTRLEKNELEALEYINHTCHNTPGDTTSGKYAIKIPIFDPGTPEK